MSDPRSKTCTKCEVEKPFTSFYRRLDSPDGRQYVCADCQKARGRTRDDVPIRVSVEVREALQRAADEKGMSMRELADLTLAAALVEATR